MKRRPKQKGRWGGYSREPRHAACCSLLSLWPSQPGQKAAGKVVGEEEGDVFGFLGTPCSKKGHIPFSPSLHMGSQLCAGPGHMLLWGKSPIPSSFSLVSTVVSMKEQTVGTRASRKGVKWLGALSPSPPS